MKRAFASGLGLAAALAFVPAAHADIISIAATADNSLFEPDAGFPPPDRSHGAGTRVFAGRIGGVGGGVGLRRALIAFDIAGSIPAGSTINFAELSVECTSHPVFDTGTTRTHTLHRVTADWGEGPDNGGSPGGNGAPASPLAATWVESFFGSTAWGTAGGDFVAAPTASTGVTDSGSLYSFGPSAALTADVQSMLDTPGLDFGWIIRGDEVSAGAARSFSSREGTTPPALRVDFTPPPPPVGKLCFGDGSSGPCPCGNVSAVGADEGCINSSFVVGGTFCGVGGSVSVVADDLALEATHPASNSGLILINTALNPPLAIFDGITCVGGGPRVLPGSDNGLVQPFGDVDLVSGDGIRNIGAAVSGSGFFGLVNAVFPGYIAAGGTYFAQFWYRDVLCGPPPLPCVTVCTTPPPAAANFTNAITFTATP